MKYLEYILLSYFILYPLYILFSHKAEKQRVVNQQESRVSVYSRTMLYLWAPLGILMVLVVNTELTLHDLGLKWQWNMTNNIGVLCLVLLGGYFLASLKSLQNNPDEHAKIKPQYEFIRWFLPVTKTESNYFIFGLAVTAGICEELLFRGYIIHMLDKDLPTYAAVILSCVLFGLGHIYQGVVHVVRTAVLGLVMAIIYLVTDSIIIPIVLHIMIDMYGGAVAFIIFSDNKTNELSTN
mgnify:FL=1